MTHDHSVTASLNLMDSLEKRVRKVRKMVERRRRNFPLPKKMKGCGWRQD